MGLGFFFFFPTPRQDLFVVVLLIVSIIYVWVFEYIPYVDPTTRTTPTIVGVLGVFFCVFGGFGIHGGDLGVLWQPIELLIIFGSGFFTLFISSPPSTLKEMARQVGVIFKGKPITKEEYTSILLCLFELFKLGKGNMLALEEHSDTAHTDRWQRVAVVRKQRQSTEIDQI